MCVHVCMRERERELGRGREEDIGKEVDVERGGIEGGRNDVCFLFKWEKRRKI